MPGHLTIPQIEEQLVNATRELVQYCSSLSDEQFFYQPETKWSAAQQVKHLTTATKTAGLAFSLPKIIVRWVGGKPNRASGTYDELVAKYKLKLEQGGKASARYVPKPIPARYGKEKLLNKFSGSMQKMARSVKKIRNEALPDQYLAPHPLLGKITLRELGYFTIHHTFHHLESIRNLAGH
jgi:DinB superfamily